MRGKTWFASIVCVVLTVPAFFIGGLGRILYLGMTLYVFGARPDPYHLHAWFQFDTLIVVWKWLNWDFLPNIFQGLIAGALALYATAFVCKGSRTARVGLNTGLFYTVLLSVVGLISLQQAGWTSDLILSVVQLIGVWLGLVHAMGQLYRE